MIPIQGERFQELCETQISKLVDAIIRIKKLLVK